MADVFISYKRAERERVEKIASALEAEQIEVWFDARLSVGGQDGFDAEIEREVIRARAVVVCWTPEATKSVYVRAEAKKGLERNVLVPVILSPCSLPVPFNDVDSVDLSAWSGDRQNTRWRRVIDRVLELKNHNKQQQDNKEWMSINAPLHAGMLPNIVARRDAFGGMWEAASEGNVADLVTALEFANKYLAAAQEVNEDMIRYMREKPAGPTEKEDLSHDWKTNLVPACQDLRAVAVNVVERLDYFIERKWTKRS